MWYFRDNRSANIPNLGEMITSKMPKPICLYNGSTLAIID